MQNDQINTHINQHTDLNKLIIKKLIKLKLSQNSYIIDCLTLDINETTRQTTRQTMTPNKICKKSKYKEILNVSSFPLYFLTYSNIKTYKVIIYIFSEHLFLRTPLEGCFWSFMDHKKQNLCYVSTIKHSAPRIVTEWTNLFKIKSLNVQFSKF